MANRLVDVTIDCKNPARLASFWSELLGRAVTDEHSGSGWATIGSRLDAQPRLTFQAVPEPKTSKVRPNVQVDGIEVGRRRVEGLGAGRPARCTNTPRASSS